MKPLTPLQRRDLRASAHHLDPVVIVGQHGLTPAVLHEIDLALLKHELIKVRIGNDRREDRTEMMTQICAASGCAPVQQLGKVLVLFRPNPELKKKPAPALAHATRKSPAKRSAAPKTGPRPPIDPVRERRRTSLRDADGAPSGKGRRGAARFVSPDAPAPPPDAPVERRKSTYTPKTRPKSHSAKPNPRSAWAKKPSATEAGAAPRPRRRKTGS